MDIIKPQKGPQEMFLSSPADIVIYGGAAGGGKTYALLLEPLRHINNSKFGAVIFRKNSNQIFAEGGLWDTAMEMYSPLQAIPYKTPTPMFKFKSGMKISFGHMDMDKDALKWQGSQIAMIAFDELTHFTKQQFFYMLSRNRSTCGVKPYVRATCNPDCDSFVAELISWWINPETGYIIPERNGVVRYMARLNNEILWADKPEDLVSEDISIEDVKSFTFIASKLSDNKILMQSNPSYLSNLKALPLVERERLLEGNWKIRPAAGLYFKRSDAVLVNDIPTNVIKWVRAWDMAATEDKKDLNPEDGPAFTAGVLIGKRKNGRYIIANVINKRLSANDVRNTIYNTAVLDKSKYKHVRIRLSQDPGQAGKDQAEQYIKFLSGFSVVAERETGSKETRAEPLAAQWQAGNVDVLIAEWTDMFLTQLESFPESKFKDMVDASSNGFNELEKGKTALKLSSSVSDANRINPWKI